MKTRNYLVNFSVLVLSVGVNLLIAEFAPRLTLNANSNPEGM